jgi:Z1 domain
LKHLDQVVRLLKTQITDGSEVAEITATARAVAERWADPLSGGVESTNGLLYGLVQSGKTGVLTATGALGADQGYRALIILTSDNDPLYAQTLSRIKEALPGMDILGKADLKDGAAFTHRVRGSQCVIVLTKNASILRTVNENLIQAKLRGASCLIIDDEADQASLNTLTSKQNGQTSAIASELMKLRSFFEKNTYLQVTATPQALFLQEAGSPFRPSFTVLSHPGNEYVGGDDFFGDTTTISKTFPITDIDLLSVGMQPVPRLVLPSSLQLALDTFVVAATHRLVIDAGQKSAFLCHVSTRKNDHRHIESLLRNYKQDLVDGLKASDIRLTARLKRAYEELATTYPRIQDTPIEQILEDLVFFSNGIAVKLVNGETDEDVALASPINLFVGGNKLGRGVTIKNLLVSYYGRHPKTPQADTVLQHARMYGYRRKELGLLRLYLPAELLTVFRAINKMEKSLRALIADSPSEEFRGIFVEGTVKPTRRNVLVPGAIGAYAGGNSYNPALVLRDSSVTTAAIEIDRLVSEIPSRTYVEVPLDLLRSLIQLTSPDPEHAEQIWHTDAIVGSLRLIPDALGQTSGYLYVDRNRELLAKRRETQGILSGGESDDVPSDRTTLFLLGLRADSGRAATWWPQLRFPKGRYAFSFNI